MSCKCKTIVGEVTRQRKTGKLGSAVTVTLCEDCRAGWAGVYSFTTHGLSAEEATVAVEGLKARHAEKANKLTSASALWNTEFQVGADRFLVSSVSVGERGTDMELRMTMRRWDGSGWAKLPGMPVLAFASSAAELPSNAGALEIMTAWAADWLGQRKAHEDYKAKLLLKLGAETGGLR